VTEPTEIANRPQTSGKTRPRRVLVAEDDDNARRALERMLTLWGYTVVPVADGIQAWEVLRQPQTPRLAVLDWMMPGMDGVEVCRRVRQEIPEPPYLLVITGRGGPDDLVAGLQGGADEYLTKPVDPSELRVRVEAGWRVADLQERLSERVRELEAALHRERCLQELLPICAWCRKVRNDQNYWQRVDEYLSEQGAVRFSHGICPTCLAEVQSELETGIS
jgi:phosphoserine phosphatase RsbU/P